MFLKHCSLECWEGYSKLPKKYIDRSEYRRRLRIKQLNEIDRCAGYPSERIVKLRYSQYKKSSYDRGHSFNISIEYFATFWGKNCFYCGEKIRGIGIDRFINSSGYDEGNCVPCCGECNLMKHKMDGEYFIKKCQNISNNKKFA